MAREKTDAHKTSKTRAEPETTGPEGGGREGHGMVL